MTITKRQILFFQPKVYGAAFLAFCIENIPRVLINRRRGSNSNIGADLSLKVPLGQTSSDGLDSTCVLLEPFPVPHWGLINTIAAREIVAKTGGRISTFGFQERTFSEQSLYSSLGINSHLRICLNSSQFFTASKIFGQTVRKILQGEKVIDLRIRQIHAGIEIYETFLRKGNATVDLYSKDLYRVLWLAIKQCVFFGPIFSSGKVAAVLVSHDSYVGPGLLARIAFSHNVPVLLINPFEIDIISDTFQLYERFERYPDYFKAQDEDWKQKGIQIAENELSRRVLGEIGLGAMKYQVKSAFTSHRIPRQIRESENKKILILSHDFFDNPHGFARMIFDDFLEWLTFVANVCLEERIDCYIKLHRDHSDLEYKVINEFQEKYPFVTLLDSEVSYHQLFEEGIEFVTTCHGSAGHELPFLGFTVINAAYNPHIAFSFNHHALSRNHYRKLIVEQVPILLDSRLRQEIYEFYAVHSMLMWPDQFNMRSYKEFMIFCSGDFTSPKARHFLEMHFLDISKQTSKNLSDALGRRRRFSVEKDLPADAQFKYMDEISQNRLFSMFS